MSEILKQIKFEFQLSSMQEAREVLETALTAQCLINDVLDQVEHNITGTVVQVRNNY